ncbi:DUF982 domain-containing protein [Mesorhizobium sp. M0204]|uniref:DUF982 domain-containing protein n=1 Tax=Mesorhizobium sp. M0204 TaxID=2956913 RepID=UPI003337CF37
MVRSPGLREDETSGHSQWGQPVEGAAEELLAWDTKGPRWTKAVQSCVDACEGKSSPQEVREAFEAAAKEANVYLSPE